MKRNNENREIAVRDYWGQGKHIYKDELGWTSPPPMDSLAVGKNLYLCMLSAAEGVAADKSREAP